jgi:hypothetical protein
VRLPRAPIGVCLLAAAGLAGADETDTWWSRLQVHGFASQAAVHTSENRWFGDSPEVSYDFTELALNASLRVTPRLLLSGQVLVRRAGDMYDGTPVLDYGLADITLVSSPQQRLGLRLGRIKNPLGLYNETRDVPFTHPGIFLPQVVYFDRVRNLVLSSDGAMLYGELYSDAGNWAITIGNGRSVIDENVEWAYLNNDFDGDVKPDTNTWLASLWYSTRNERLKLGLSGAQLRIGFDPDVRSSFTVGPGTTDLTYGIASFQYNAADWTLSAEYAREPLKWRGYGPLAPDRDATGEGWYVQGTYRIRPDISFMLRYEEGFADTADRSGRKLEAATGGLVPRHAGFSKILTTGLRWDINNQWMLRVEYAYNDGTFILSGRENPDFLDQHRYWNLFSVQAAFRF